MEKKPFKKLWKLNFSEKSLFGTTHKNQTVIEYLRTDI